MEGSPPKAGVPPRLNPQAAPFMPPKQPAKKASKKKKESAAPAKRRGQRDNFPRDSFKPVPPPPAASSAAAPRTDQTKSAERPAIEQPAIVLMLNGKKRRRTGTRQFLRFFFVFFLFFFFFFLQKRKNRVPALLLARCSKRLLPCRKWAKSWCASWKADVTSASFALLLSAKRLRFGRVLIVSWCCIWHVSPRGPASREERHRELGGVRIASTCSWTSLAMSAIAAEQFVPMRTRIWWWARVARCASDLASAPTVLTRATWSVILARVRRVLFRAPSEPVIVASASIASNAPKLSPTAPLASKRVANRLPATCIDASAFVILEVAALVLTPSSRCAFAARSRQTVLVARASETCPNREKEEAPCFRVPNLAIVLLPAAIIAVRPCVMQVLALRALRAWHK